MTPVILYSGGLDSFVLACDIILNPRKYKLKKGDIPALLHFTAPDSAHSTATKMYHEKQLPYLAELAGEEIKQRTISMEGLLITYPPPAPRPLYTRANHASRFLGDDVGRQVMFMSLAFNYASSFDGDRVYAAFQMDPDRRAFYNKSRWNDAGDDTPRFRDAINRLAFTGFIHTQKLYTPFLDSRLSKVQVIQLGIKLAVPMHYTYSCVFQGPTPCGCCNACVYFNRAVAKLGYNPRQP